MTYPDDRYIILGKVIFDNKKQEFLNTPEKIAERLNERNDDAKKLSSLINDIIQGIIKGGNK